MNSSVRTSSLWTIGLAMFSMFFGAGNIVFPLAIGQFTQDKNVYAILGMIITAVFVPLAGLFAMILYEGDYGAFFKRIGKWPGFAVTLAILGLIGPLGGIPRCVTISYSTLASFGVDKMSGVNLYTFSLFSCLVIFVFTFRPSKVLALLGYVLTPILLLSLGLIVGRGFFTMPEAESSLFTKWQTFSKGFIGGYNTMDLLAAFFFSSVILLCLKKNQQGGGTLFEGNPKILYKTALGSSLIAAFLLITVYVSFSFLAAGYSSNLENIAHHQILGELTYQLLGPYAGLVAGVAVAFACLTTEIALTVVFSEFLRKNLFKEKISYRVALLMTLLITLVISTLNFQGISSFLAPILQICYPALIVLTILNILYKFYHFAPIKILFYGTFAISLIAYFYI
jgi:LIVCS family branched-chain amino acid:cation transporter